MTPPRFARTPGLLLSDGAQALACAALTADGDLRDASALDATLEHVEEAIDALARALQAAAAGVGDGGEGGGEADALAWHLAETARRLRAAGEGCASSRRWSRRLTEPV